MRYALFIDGWHSVFSNKPKCRNLVFQLSKDRLGHLKFTKYPRLISSSEICVAKLMESVVVIKIAIGVKKKYCKREQETTFPMARRIPKGINP